MNPALESAAVAHAADTEQIERWLLSAGFYDETNVAFGNALTNHSLGTSDFLGPFHREVAQALLAHAQVSEQPTFETLRVVSEACGADWTIGDGRRLEVILDATCHANLIDRHAELLAGAVERRRRARGLIDEAERLLGGDPPGRAAVVSATAQPSVHVPRGVRTAIRRRSRRA